MPSPPSLYSIPSAPGTPTSFESTCEVARGPKVLNGRLVKSKPRQPTQSTSSRPLPPSTLSSPSPLAEGMKDHDDNDNHDNDNDNQAHLNATKEPQKHSRDKEVKPANKIWKLMKRISTGGLRDKYTSHSPSFSMSSGKGPVAASGIGGPTRSLSRAAQLRVTKLSNYSEESLALSHQSQGSYGSLVASSSHTSHGESVVGPGSGFNSFNHDRAPPPVPAIPKDLQNHHLNGLLPASSPSSPASLSFSEPGSNMSRKHHRRDRDSRSASSPIPSISSPLSPGQSSASYSSASSPPPPHTPSPSPSAPSKKRILSRISSMGLLRRKPSIASGLASSLGFGAQAAGTPETPDRAERNGANTEAPAPVAVQEVPVLTTIPNIPSTPVSKAKSTKYSISCIPIPSIPSMPSMSIIASSTPSTPTKSNQISSISFSSSSSRPGTGKTTLSQSSSTSSPRLSLDSRSRSHSRSMGMLVMQSRRGRSKSMSRSRSRSCSLDSVDSLGRRRIHRDHAHTTPTRNKRNSNHRNNNNNHNHNTVLANNNNDYPYPLDKHIVPPLELSATFSGEDDNRWGVEHVLSGGDDCARASSSSVSLPATEHNGQGSLCRRDGVSADSGLGPKRVNRAINNRSSGSKDMKVNKREETVDKWERLLERRDKMELDKLDGFRSKSVAAHGGRGRESWTIVRSPEPEELPSLPVPPRKKTKERERRREKEEKWERSASVDVPASPVSSSPVYRGRAFVDDIPAPSTFGRVMGKQIGAEENRRSSLSPIQGRASFSIVGDDARKNGRDGSRKRRSLSAVRSPSALIFSSSPKDGQTVPSPRSWTKSLSSPVLRKNSVDVAPVVPTTALAVTTPPRALGTLFRKLSFSGVSASPAGGTEKRRNRSPRRPSTASSVPSAKARNGSIAGGSKSGFFWNGGNGDNKHGESESLSSSLPRRLLRKNSLLKGRSNTGNQDKEDKPRMMRRPRTADALSSTSNNNSGTLTEKEKRERWEKLLERSERAGGTLHLCANGEGLLSDRMRMSMVSMVSEVSGAHVGVREE